jgi:hypothetical protein
MGNPLIYGFVYDRQAVGAMAALSAVVGPI